MTEDFRLHWVSMHAILTQQLAHPSYLSNHIPVTAQTAKEAPE